MVGVKVESEVEWSHSSVFIKETLDVSGAEVSLVHHLGRPPGLAGRGVDGLRLATGPVGPGEKHNYFTSKHRKYLAAENISS